MVKTCLSTYSLWRYNGVMSIYDMISKTAEWGFEAIEFTDGPWLFESDEKELRRIGDAARSAGLDVVNLCCDGDLINGSDGDLDREVERICRNVDKAALLGSRMMRHDAGHLPRGRKRGLGYSYNLPRLAEGCRRITEYAENVGVMTLTENHGVFSQDPDRVASLVDAVDHPNFGLLVDIGNFMDIDYVPYKAVAKLAPYAYHVHCKDCLFKKGTEIFPGDNWYCTAGGNYNRGTIVGHGDAGISQCVRILKNAGYEGCISIEYEGVEDAMAGIPASLANVKRFWDIA